MVGTMVLIFSGTCRGPLHRACITSCHGQRITDIFSKSSFDIVQSESVFQHLSRMILLLAI